MRVFLRLIVESATTGVAEAIIQPDGFANARIFRALINAPGHPVLTD